MITYLLPMNIDRLGQVIKEAGLLHEIFYEDLFYNP